MNEGLFWVICSMVDDAIDWDVEWSLYHLYAKSDSISHKDAWTQIVQPENKEFRRLDFDYYPRGRVVVKNDRATVFISRHIVIDEVLEIINTTFNLTTPKIHAEGGKHYQCFLDK